VFPLGGLAVRADERCAVAGSFDGGVYVADLRAMRVLHALQGHEDRVTRVAVRGDDVLSAGFDSTLRLWHL
jgi:WD40 repeat protein